MTNQFGHNSPPNCLTTSCCCPPSICLLCEYEATTECRGGPMERSVAKAKQQLTVAARPAFARAKVQVKGGLARWFTGCGSDSYPLRFVYTIKVTKGGWFRNTKERKRMQSDSCTNRLAVLITVCCLIIAFILTLPFAIIWIVASGLDEISRGLKNGNKTN